MSKHAQLSDGTVLEFPDDTADAVMDRVVKQHMGVSSAPAPDKGTVSVAEAQKTFDAARPKETAASQLLRMIQGDTFGKHVINIASDLGGMASSAYHSLVDPATPEEEKQFGNQPGPLELSAKRMLVDPSVANYEHFKTAPNLASKIAYGLGMVPVAGPIGITLGETAVNEGIPRALDKAAAFAVSPKIMEEIPGIPRTAADAIRAKMPTAESLAKAAAENKARALNPTTLQGRSDAAQISGEMAERGMAGGLRQKTIDANITKELESSGRRVSAVEDRLRQSEQPEHQFDRDELLSEIDAAKKKLNLPRTGETLRPEAVGHLDSIRNIIARLPRWLAFDQMIELRRQLDARAEDAGAFGVNADNLKADLNRGVANIARGKLNAVDVGLKAANHDYSLSRKAADMVARRQLGETGKISSGIPGRGGILDDVLAGWAGQALGGTAGGFAAEAINLGRQTPGWANAKSALQQRLSNSLMKPRPEPAGLIGSGAIPLSPVSDASEITIRHGREFTRPQITSGATPLGPGADTSSVTGEVAIKDFKGRRIWLDAEPAKAKGQMSLLEGMAPQIFGQEGSSAEAAKAATIPDGTALEFKSKMLDGTEAYHYRTPDGMRFVTDFAISEAKLKPPKMTAADAFRARRK